MTFYAKRKLAFTLLEVVLALTVFIVIATPVIGLLAMSVESGQIGARAVNAEALARGLFNDIDAATPSALSWDLDATPQILYASEDLAEIGFAADVVAADRYFQATVREPIGSIYNETINDNLHRLLLLEIRWPAYENGTPVPASSQSKLDQMIIPIVVFKK